MYNSEDYNIDGFKDPSISWFDGEVLQVKLEPGQKVFIKKTETSVTAEYESDSKDVFYEKKGTRLQFKCTLGFPTLEEKNAIDFFTGKIVSFQPHRDKNFKLDCYFEGYYDYYRHICYFNLSVIPLVKLWEYEILPTISVSYIPKTNNFEKLQGYDQPKIKNYELPLTTISTLEKKFLYEDTIAISGDLVRHYIKDENGGIKVQEEHEYLLLGINKEIFNNIKVLDGAYQPLYPHTDNEFNINVFIDVKSENRSFFYKDKSFEVSLKRIYYNITPEAFWDGETIMIIHVPDSQ